MKKDGTRYLAHVMFPNGECEWCVVHWGVPCGASDPSLREGWICRMFKLKKPVFLDALELDTVVKGLKREEISV